MIKMRRNTKFIPFSFKHLGSKSYHILTLKLNSFVSSHVLILAVSVSHAV